MINPILALFGILLWVIFGIFGLVFIASNIFLELYIPFARRFLQSGFRDHLTMGEHAQKKTTPTMGGFVFLIPLLFLWYQFSHEPTIHFILIATFTSAMVGFADDWLKIKRKRGMDAWPKFLLQAGGALLAVLYWYLTDSSFSSIIDCGLFSINAGIFYIFWAVFVIMATSHAVNLTDGLDGLATSQALLVLAAFMVCTYKNTLLFVSADHMLMACFAFLVFNWYPAKVFMGDVGSLGLGAFLATLFLAAKKELLLPVFGMFFVIETLSVIVQCAWFKRTKKRIFLCAPLHHHFEAKGWREKKIVGYAVLFTCSIIALVIVAAYFWHPEETIAIYQ